MSDQALYRKYRSSTFTEVVGQEHVVRTLTSAITSGRISHAYLFTGPRGVGKTSVARLLARAVNCTSTETKPCNECFLCKASMNSSLDIIEIDAASNRSIDSVRDLREKIALAPSQGKYKVYIIDEVHMLTTEAFNALLKTLEEPPAHAIFVLATTEAHKIPETIISRTQRFTFKPILASDIIQHLRTIAGNEKVNIDSEALEIIANYSRGGFRDAISMLDQLASSGATAIDAGTVRALLGYSSSEELANLTGAMIDHNAQAALETLARLHESGAQSTQIANQLAEQWRGIMTTAAGIAAQEPAVKELTHKLAKSVADSGGSPTHVQAIASDNLSQLLEVSRSHWPQLALEAVIVKLCLPQEAPAAAPAQPQATEAKPTKPIADNAAAKSKPVPYTKPVEPKEELPTAAGSDGKLNPGLWPKVLVILKSKNNSLCALLQMYPIDFTDEEVTIKPRFNFHRDLFLKPANRTVIEAAASKVYGRAVRVNARTDEAVGGGKKRRTPDPAAELVSSALEILGGEIVE